jgi:hypothetical protein
MRDRGGLNTFSHRTQKLRPLLDPSSETTKIILSLEISFSISRSSGEEKMTVGVA